MTLYYRCLTCPTLGTGDGLAHSRSRKHKTETTDRREVFARWQREVAAR